MIIFLECKPEAQICKSLLIQDTHGFIYLLQSKFHFNLPNFQKQQFSNAGLSYREHPFRCLVNAGILSG